MSLLSLLSKLLERIVHKDSLSNKQFGFRLGNSTQEALLHVTHDWHLSMDKGSSISTVLFDLSKEFDLSNRKQRVVLDGHSSTIASITSGVPQGYILGPLLFLAYMNSLTTIPLSPGSQLILYADDMLFYRPISCQQGIAALQKDIDSICHWVRVNGLSLNSSKTKAAYPLSEACSPESSHLRQQLGSNTGSRLFEVPWSYHDSNDLTRSSHISKFCAITKSNWTCSTDISMELTRKPSCIYPGL